MSGRPERQRPAEDEPAQEYRLQEQIGFVLRKAHQRHVAIFAGKISGLTPPQFATLAKLLDIGETSQNQLGSLVAMDAATVKGVIDRLKSRGLVALTRREIDRRRVMVSLTREGAELVRSLVPLAEKITAETLEPLSAGEAETLLRLLSRIA